MCCIYDKNTKYGDDRCEFCSAMCPERLKEFKATQDINGLRCYVRKDAKALEDMIPKKLYDIGMACIEFITAYEAYHPVPKNEVSQNVPRYVSEPKWSQLGCSTADKREVWLTECHTCKDFFEHINNEERCLLFKWFDKYFYNFMTYIDNSKI